MEIELVVDPSPREKFICKDVETGLETRLQQTMSGKVVYFIERLSLWALSY